MDEIKAVGQPLTKNELRTRVRRSVENARTNGHLLRMTVELPSGGRVSTCVRCGMDVSVDPTGKISGPANVRLCQAYLKGYDARNARPVGRTSIGVSRTLNGLTNVAKREEDGYAD